LYQGGGGLMSKRKKILTIVLISVGILSICAGVVIFSILMDKTRELNSIIKEFELIETSGYDLSSTQYKNDLLLNSDTINCRIDKDVGLKAYVDKTMVRLNELSLDSIEKYKTENECIFFKDGFYKLENEKDWVECNVKESLFLDLKLYVDLLNKPKFEFSEDGVNSFYKVSYSELEINYNERIYIVNDFNLVFTVEKNTSKILAMNLSYILDGCNCKIDINILYENQKVILPE
jgi:hypothetical protein